jgi:hypothetical protein
VASFDAADLLARVKVLAQRPVPDESVPDATWYSLLTEAQAHWTNVFATQVPFVLMSAPVSLTTSDGGFTYQFPNSIYPLAVEVYDTTTPARLLRPSSYWDSSGDYVWEGHQIRFPQGQANTLAIAPVARYIAPPDVIDGSTAPTLMPPHCRLLLVYRAVAEWANRAGSRDPTPFYDMERRFWIGNPQWGDAGVLGALKTQNPFYGGTGLQMGSGGILEGVDTGAGYRRYPP